MTSQARPGNRLLVGPGANRLNLLLLVAAAHFGCSNTPTDPGTMPQAGGNRPNDSGLTPSGGTEGSPQSATAIGGSANSSAGGQKPANTSATSGGTAPSSNSNPNGGNGTGASSWSVSGGTQASISGGASSASTVGGAGASGVSIGGASAGGVSAGGVATGSSGRGGVSAGGVSISMGAAGGLSGAGTAGVGMGGVTVTDTVSRSTSTYRFQHFPVETNSEGVWNGPASPGTQLTTTTYNTVVLENGYLRVTLLPDYGGRILSIVHKPTNRELLYQNPLGTPYLMQEAIFYYDYLVIMGGIFPSFPEPEHGKYWNQPYSFKVVNESKDAITVRMSRQDDQKLVGGVPARYDVGRTDVLVELDVTLRAGSTSLELGTKLTNTQSKPIAKFEYWTVTTLAPGSTPGKTAIPLNTRILAAMDKVHLLESSWSWFGNAETRVSGEVFKWNNLSYFKNWVDQGTAFANPDYRANWSSLVNYDNDTGIVRVSENVKTPGLKLWTFGKGSLNIDVNDSSEWLRPTIEMWHGVTPEFFTRGTMSANEVRQWSDNYFPILGLREITAASNYGALYLSSAKTGADTQLSVATTLTVPNQIVRAILRLNGNVLAEQDVVVAEKDATKVNVTVANSKASSGSIFEAEFLQGDKSLLSGRITIQ